MVSEQYAGLRWTGHPLPDMGIAAILVYARKEMPEEITVEDLERLAQEAERWYFSKVLSGYLTVLFTSNFLNTSWTPNQKVKYAQAVLRAFNWPLDETGPMCAYCHRPSVRPANLCGRCDQVHHEAICPSCKKEGVTRAYRDLVPMLTGRDVINFFPQGQHGLALCGLCIVALQALSIGAPYCEGKAVIVEVGDAPADREILRAVVQDRFATLQRLLSVQTDAKPANIRGPRTRVIEALARWQQERAPDGEDEEVEKAGPLTVYHLSNSGQGPGIEIYPLPSNVVQFVKRAQGQRYRGVWNQTVRRAWEGKRREGEEPPEEERRALRNRFYDDLFTLPDNAGVFLRRWFNWRPEQIAGLTPETLLKQERWPFVVMFLEEVLRMEQVRVTAIRSLADRVAADIADTNDRQIFRRFFSGRTDYRTVRDTLIRADRRRVQRLGEPLVTLDDFLTVFEEGEEVARADWRLAWDLLRIRMVEELCRLGWFQRPEGREIMSEVDREEADEQAEEVGATV